MDYGQYQDDRADAIQKAEEEIELQREAITAEFLSEHEQDAKNFAISCERVGDFMRITSTRISKRQPSVIDANQEKFWPATETTGVNLSKVTSIDLKEGSAPSADGQRFWFNIYYKSLSGTLPMVSIADRTAGATGEALVAKPTSHFWSPRGERLRFSVGPVVADNSLWPPYYESSADMAPGTHLFPTAAVDDAVFLRGLDTTIYAPFGCGQMVVDRMMDAIKAGAVAA
jgi:hypothetical protein